MQLSIGRWFGFGSKENLFQAKDEIKANIKGQCHKKRITSQKVNGPQGGFVLYDRGNHADLSVNVFKTLNDNIFRCIYYF